MVHDGAASGSSYFGKTMNEPAIIGKRINRSGTIELGELKVLGMDGKSAENLADTSGKDTPFEKVKVLFEKHRFGCAR